MKTNNKKGFFLSETLVVIAVVAVVLVSVFSLFASVYTGFKNTEKYNTTNSINAMASINNYITSKGNIDTSLLTASEPVLDITNSTSYNDAVYSEIKKEFEIEKIYLINMDMLFNGNKVDNYNVELRKYLKTLNNVRGTILLLITENSEYSYSQVAAPNYKDCSFTGEEESGAEYVNGQYTYRYLQEYTPSGWQDISSGWGIKLTDLNSTDPVTSNICGSINDKPITSSSAMFYNSNAASIDLTSFDTSKITNMKEMFSGLKATVLNLNNFDTSNVTNMEAMFKNSEVLTLYLKSFNTSNVTNMKEMFSGSKATTLNVTSFDTSKVTNMEEMFKGSKIDILDLSSFDVSNSTNVNKMFSQVDSTLGYAKNRVSTSNLNNSGSKSGKLMFITNPKVVFEIKGDTVFTGMNNVDTEIRLFDANNASKDFEISFNIVSYDSTQQKYATIMNSMDETGSPYYGMIFRFPNPQVFHVEARASSTVALNRQIDLYTGYFRIIRVNNVIYYSINNGDYVKIVDFSEFKDYINTPVTFGSSLDASLKPFRYFRGTLSDIIIRLED